MKHLSLASFALLLSVPSQAEIRDVRDDECRVVLDSASLSCVRSNCTLSTIVYVRRDLGPVPPQVLAKNKQTGEWSTFFSRYQPGQYGDYNTYQIDLYAGAAGFSAEIIPFVELGELRYFDHNLLKGDLENYQVGGGLPSISRNAARACGI